MPRVQKNRVRVEMNDPVRQFFMNLKTELIENNQDRFIAKCGKRGNGKSYATMTEGHIITGGNFDPVKHISYFDPWKFMRLVKKSKPGDFLMFDDAGVGVDNREWYKKSNKLISKIVQTFRTKNLFVVWTMPDFGIVDIKARKTFDWFVKMDKLNMKKRQARSRWYEIVTDAWSGEFWRKTLSFSYNGRTTEIHQVLTDHPPEWMVEPYEKNRKKALDKIFKSADDAQTGSDKGVTIEQATKMLNLESSRVMWDIIVKGGIRMEQESNLIKIPLKDIRKISKSLNTSFKAHTEIKTKAELEEFKPRAEGLKTFELNDGRFLLTFDSFHPPNDPPLDE